MPQEKKAATQAAEQVLEGTLKTSGERKLPYEVLKKNCVKLFHVTTSTFTGATIGKENRTYTVSEMRSIIAKWLKTTIKNKKEVK